MTINKVIQATLTDNRYVILNNNGSIFVKEGINANWINITQTAVTNFPAMQSVAVCGKRIVALTVNGQVYGTSPDHFTPAYWSGNWSGLLTDETKQIALAENRIFVLKTSGEIWVKEGDWGAGWVNITQKSASNLPKMQAIAAEGNRLVGITTTGLVYGTDSTNFNTSWNGVWSGLLTDKTQEIALAENRIFALKSDGQIWVKEGGWGAGWYIITQVPKGGNLPKMKAITAQGKRIVGITIDGEVYGTSPDHFDPNSWNGVWSGLLTNHAVDIAVTANQLLVVQEDGSLMLKQGGWGAGWVQLNQRVIAVYTRSGYPSENVLNSLPHYSGTQVNTLILSGPNGYQGGIVYNDPPYLMFDESGNYVGDSKWPASLATIKASTSINSIYFSLGNSAISALAGLSTIQLATVMNWLKSNGITGVDIDAENWGQEGGLSPMDSQVQIVTLAIIKAGLELTAAPYNDLEGWKSWQTFVIQNGGSISWMNVQCYAGGVYNDPVQDWYTQFNPHIPVLAGFESNPGPDNGAMDPTQARQQLQEWQAESPQFSLAGAFVWEYSIIQSGTYSVQQYAEAMVNGLSQK